MSTAKVGEACRSESRHAHYGLVAYLDTSQTHQKAEGRLVQSKGFSRLPVFFERPPGTVRCYLWHRKMMNAATIFKVTQIVCDRLQAKT
jgi:hypothetical protein